MIRSKEATGKTVEEARAAACAALGVSEDDLNVSYEVLEMPQSTGFLGLKKIPAKVRVIVEEEDPAPAAPEKPAVKVVRAEKAQPAEPAEKAEKAQPAPAPQPAEKPAPQPAPAQKPAAAPAAQAPAAAVTAAPAAVDETPVPIDIEANPKVKAAVEYLKEIVALMGVEDVTFSAVQKGEATIIRLDGDKMGALIGRRGETMESLSYLASLVANRMEGDYIKLGLDVAGYRGKRENDLTALAQKIGQKVRRSGRCFSMEPMNPYERRIIHSTSAGSSTRPSARWRACAARARVKARTATSSSTPPSRVPRPKSMSAVPAAAGITAAAITAAAGMTAATAESVPSAPAAVSAVPAATAAAAPAPPMCPTAALRRWTPPAPPPSPPSGPSGWTTLPTSISARSSCNRLFPAAESNISV